MSARALEHTKTIVRLPKAPKAVVIKLPKIKTVKVLKEKRNSCLAIPCLQCGGLVLRTPGNIREKTFCCRQCHDVYRLKGPPRKGRICITCGIVYKGKKPTQTHCSRKCFETDRKERMRGDKNPSYVDGRSYSQSYNAGDTWQDIRRMAYKRDNYCCQHCGVKCVAKNRATEETNHRVIQCHHIELYRLTQDNSLDNLITLCLSCHARLHGALKCKRQKKGGVHDTQSHRIP